MNDSVNKPAHYQFAGFEVIDLIRDAVTHVGDAFAATLYGNVIKYVFRWPRKDGVRDLKKARWYLERLIDRMECKEAADAATANDQRLGLYDEPRIPPPPDYDPASVAFRHGDLGWLGEEQKLLDAFGDQQARKSRSATELADADGCMEYGNPIAPDCAPWRLP